MRDSEGRLSVVFGMAEDITKQKEAERTLRRAERLASVGTLAAGVAHEVNNPLQGIVFFAEVALDSLAVGPAGIFVQDTLGLAG